MRVPPRGTSSDNDLRKKLVACTGQAGAPDTDKVATADSQNFSQGQIQASSSFDLYRSESDVSADLAQIMSPKAESCLNSALKASLSTELPAGTTVASSTFTLVRGSSGGPKNIVAQGLGVVKIVAQGKPATVYLGVAFITGPKLMGTVSYVGIDQNVDTSVAGKAAALVAERAAKG